jgi:hypothetical protein
MKKRKRKLPLYEGQRQSVPRADLAKLPKTRGKVTVPSRHKPLPGQLELDFEKLPCAVCTCGGGRDTCCRSAGD